MSFAIPAGAFVVLAVVWGMANVARSKEILALRQARAQSRTVLTTFAQVAMAHNSINQIAIVAGEVASKIFGAQRLLVLEEDAEGRPVSVPLTASHADGDGRVLTPPVETSDSGLLAWFRANPATIFDSDLKSGVGGHMSSRLQAMVDTCSVDVIMPLVHHGEVLAILGLSIDRSPSHLDRELLRIFRLEVTAACANVHLHHEVSHLHSLVDEVNVATGLDLSMIPKEMSGTMGKFKWCGHFSSADQAGSDFWGTYPLSGNRVLVVMGDSVGRKLAGSMVSAAVKSCCDQIIADKGDSLNPAEILSILSASLFRATHSALASCVVAILDPTRSQVTYANAGHQLPYCLRAGKEGLTINVLQGTGPMLGDLLEPKFQMHTARLSNSDSLVFLTDGLLAPRDAQDDAFGYRRLHRLLRHQTSNDPETLREAIVASISAHSADPQLRDDQAMLIVKWA
jgi:serine phosphatase RsbU (regulator of sigma subunit)